MKGEGSADRPEPQTGEPVSPRGTEAANPRADAPGELPSYFEEPEPVSWWKQIHLKKYFWASAGALAVIAVVILLAPGAYRGLKARRALAILAGAEEAMARGDEALAREKFHVGFSMAPGDPRVNRILTRLNAASGDPASIDVLVGWLKDGAATPEECLALSAAANRKGDFVLAARALDALPKKLSPDLEAARVLARGSMLAKSGHVAESVQLLSSASLPEKQARRVRLALGTLLLVVPESDVGQGRSILQALGESGSEEGLEALRRLARFQLSSNGTFGWDNASRLLKHPLRMYQDRLLYARIQLGSAGADREKVIGELINESKNRDLADRRLLAQWLMAINELAQVESLFSADELAGSEPVFLAFADALAAQGRWSEIRSRLESPKRPPMDEALRQLFLALVAGRMGEPDSDHWKAVSRELPFSPDQAVRQVAGQSLKTGQVPLAKQALELLVERKKATQAEFIALVKLLPPDAPAEQALAVLSRFKSAYPELPELKGDCAYLSLLAGQDVIENYSIAQDLAEKHPAYLSYVTTLALAELRLGHAANAARLYEGRQIDWGAANPHFKVVRIAVLEANGDSAEADVLRATLDPKQLRPEEVELIKRRARP